MPQNLNAGLGVDYSVNEYYQVAAEVVGFNGDFWHNHDRPVGMKQKLVDVGLLRKFGWKHKVSLRQGLSEAYSFYLDELADTSAVSKRKDHLIK